jgi:cysteine-rich repeat protein
MASECMSGSSDLMPSWNSTRFLALGIGFVAATWCLATAAQQPALRITFEGTASPGTIFVPPGNKPPVYVPARNRALNVISASGIPISSDTDETALQFNAPAAVAIPFDLDVQTDPQITIVAWVRRGADSRIGWLVNTGSSQGLPSLRIYNSRLRGRAGRIEKTMDVRDAEIPAGEWTFIAGVWDYEASTMQLYMNSLSQTFRDDRGRMSSDSVSGQVKKGGFGREDTHYITIGARDAEGFSGAIRNTAIDDVAIYTTALNKDEIAAIRRGNVQFDSLAPGTRPRQDLPVGTTSGDTLNTNGQGICGDAITDLGEDCDDGNSHSGDGCSAICELEFTCGDGITDVGEDCDDGNNMSGDGCSAICQSE